MSTRIGSLKIYVPNYFFNLILKLNKTTIKITHSLNHFRGTAVKLIFHSGISIAIKNTFDSINLEQKTGNTFPTETRRMKQCMKKMWSSKFHQYEAFGVCNNIS